MSLKEALDLVPDSRSSQGRRHSLGAILALATCAMLCGCRSLYAIAQWGRDQGGATAQLLGFSHSCGSQRSIGPGTPRGSGGGG